MTAALQTPGQSLDATTRQFFEPRFKYDFGSVRIHADDRAAQSAQAISALAFTQGRDICFGAGQYSPRSASGKRLLAHELAHVVQQSTVPNGMVLRKPSPEDEKKKREAIEHHKQQQRHVADLLKNAQTIKANPKQPLAADNVYRNTAELINDGKATLFVLTPTHYSTDDNPFYFDVRHPLQAMADGDYHADRTDPDVTKLDRDGLAIAGLAHPAPGTTGETLPHKETTLAIETLPRKEEEIGGTSTTKSKPSAPSPPKWIPPDIRLFGPETEIPEDKLKNTLVHEGQHAADMSQQILPGLTDWQKSLEVYKTEFRAFWVQPPEVPGGSGDVRLGSTDKFPEATEKPDNDRTIKPSTCAGCTPSETKTDFQNKRQESIFWRLFSNPNYNNALQLDCNYACVADFKKAVDAFDVPRSVNLINSTRLLTLNLELQGLNKTIKLEDMSKTGFPAAVQSLDDVDWAFLRQTIPTAGKSAKEERRPSDPFWESIDHNAPDFVKKAMQSWVKSGQPPSVADINRQLTKP